MTHMGVRVTESCLSLLDTDPGVPSTIEDLSEEGFCVLDSL